MPTLKEKGEALLKYADKYRRLKNEQEALIISLRVQGLMMVEGMDPENKATWSEYSWPKWAEALNYRLKEVDLERARILEELKAEKYGPRIGNAHLGAPNWYRGED